MTLREQVRQFLESHPDVAQDLRDGHLTKQAFGRKYAHHFSSDSHDNIARQATYVLREMGEGAPEQSRQANTRDEGEEPNWRYWRGEQADHVFSSDEQYHDPHEEMDNPESSDKCLMFMESRRYVFVLKKYDNVTVTFDEMSDIIRCYVYEGSGMTQKQVCRHVAKDEWREKHGRVLSLQHGQFKRMMWAIRVDKNSLPFAPHEYRTKSVDELTSKWRAQAEAAVEDSYRAKEAKHWKRKFRDEVRERVKAEQLVSEITDSIPAAQIVINVDSVDHDDTLEPHTLVVGIADWHVGASVKAGANSYNKDVGRKRVEQFKSWLTRWFKCNPEPVDAVRWVMLGDIVEGQEMRADHGRSLDLWREEQTDQASKLISELLAHGHALKPDVPHYADCVGGNHGRGTSERGDDPARVLDLATYQIARAYTRDLGIEWSITSDIVHEFRVYGTQVLLSHGERIPRDFDKLIRARLDKTCSHHILITGHYHSDHAEGELDSLQVQIGSLIGDTPYGLDSVGVRSRPSQRCIPIYRRNGPVLPGQFVLD